MCRQDMTEEEMILSENVFQKTSMHLLFDKERKDQKMLLSKTIVSANNDSQKIWVQLFGINEKIAQHD